jgi:hypothetical protein
VTAVLCTDNAHLEKLTLKHPPFVDKSLYGEYVISTQIDEIINFMQARATCAPNLVQAEFDIQRLVTNNSSSGGEEQKRQKKNKTTSRSTASRPTASARNQRSSDAVISGDQDAQSSQQQQQQQSKEGKLVLYDSTVPFLLTTFDTKPSDTAEETWCKAFVWTLRDGRPTSGALNFVR